MGQKVLFARESKRDSIQTADEIHQRSTVNSQKGCVSALSTTTRTQSVAVNAHVRTPYIHTSFPPTNVRLKRTIRYPNTHILLFSLFFLFNDFELDEIPKRSLPHFFQLRSINHLGWLRDEIRSGGGVGRVCGGCWNLTVSGGGRCCYSRHIATTAKHISCMCILQAEAVALGSWQAYDNLLALESILGGLGQRDRDFQ